MAGAVRTEICFVIMRVVIEQLMSRAVISHLWRLESKEAGKRMTHVPRSLRGLGIQWFANIMHLIDSCQADPSWWQRSFEVHTCLVSVSQRHCRAVPQTKTLDTLIVISRVSYSIRHDILTLLPPFN
jgi:hypothetical protein